MNRSVLPHRNGIQLSYSLPSILHTTHVYPRKSSNGSTVIVYGHDSGLSVVWYAGRQFKSPEEAAKINGNGNPKDNPAVIDLEDDDDDDDDDAPQKPHQAAALQFEDEDDEVDPSRPYPDVLRQLDVPLGTEALHLAQCETSIDRLDPDRYPAILQDKIVLAVACSDLSMSLVVIPLLPPAPGSTAAARTAIQTLKFPIGGVGFHQQFVTSLALTFTEQEREADSHEQDGTETSKQWSFLVASTSCTGSGLLLIHQIPVDGSRLSTNPQDLLPVRRVRPRAPLSAARLSFNTCPPPATRHSTLLITLPDVPCVKIYQVFPQNRATGTRRGSTGTIDSVSSRGSMQDQALRNGKMLINLLPGFAPSTRNEVDQRRKKVLDAKWITGGCAILALLEDGEFGIWDLEAAGPSSAVSSKNPIQGQANISGIVGGSLTQFAVSARFGSNQTKADATKPAPQTKLAPATPHTRRIRAEGLFRGTRDISNDNSNTYSSRGSISVTVNPDSPLAESVLINYNSELLYISSVQAFWHAAIASSRTNLKIGTLHGPISVPSPNTIGGSISNIALLPNFRKQLSGNYGAKSTPNFLVSTSSHLILFVQPLEEPAVEDLQDTPMHALAIRNNEDSLFDSNLGLDVGAMDQILDRMDTSRPTAAIGKRQPNFGQSVQFTTDNEGDVDMASPSPAKFGALSSLKSSGTQRRLFS